METSGAKQRTSENKRVDLANCVATASLRYYFDLFLSWPTHSVRVLTVKRLNQLEPVNEAQREKKKENTRGEKKIHLQIERANVRK